MGYYFPKVFNAAAGYQHLERGANEMGSNLCACTVFLQNEIYSSPQKTPFVHVGVETAISLETSGLKTLEFIQMIWKFGSRRNVANFGSPTLGPPDKPNILRRLGKRT